MNQISARLLNNLLVLLILATCAVLKGQAAEPSIAIVDKLEIQFYFFRQSSGAWTVYRGANPKTYCNGHQIITNDADVIRCYAPFPDGVLNVKFKLPSPYKGSRRVACDTTASRWIGMQEFDYDLGDVRFHQFKLDDGHWRDVRPLPIYGDEDDLYHGTGQGFKLVSESDSSAQQFLYYSKGAPRSIVKSGYVSPVYGARNPYSAGTQTLDCTNATDRNGRFCVFELQASNRASVDNQQFTWTLRFWDTGLTDWQINGPRVTSETTAAIEPNLFGSSLIVNGSTGYLDNYIAVFFSRAATVVWSEEGQRFTKLQVETPTETKLLGMFELSDQLFFVASDEKERRIWIAETRRELLTREDKVEPSWTEATFIDVVEMAATLTKTEKKSMLFWLRSTMVALALATTVLAFVTFKSIRRSRATTRSGAANDLH